MNRLRLGYVTWKKPDIYYKNKIQNRRWLECFQFKPGTNSLVFLSKDQKQKVVEIWNKSKPRKVSGKEVITIYILNLLIQYVEVVMLLLKE